MTSLFTRNQRRGTTNPGRPNQWRSIEQAKAKKLKKRKASTARSKYHLAIKQQQLLERDAARYSSEEGLSK